ncbi:MAG: alpha/beta fold hydrolase [Acidobacteriota bacterium]
MRTNCRRTFVASLGLIALLASIAAAQKRDVDLTAPDGVKLKASYYPGSKPGPGVLLLHMCGGATRQSWDRLATLLAATGIHVLTLDYRGFGESGDERFDTLDTEHRRAAQAKWAGDIDVAFDYLLAQPGVDRRRAGAAGASCGANNSAQLALRHPEVTALVFLSGGVNRASLDHLRHCSSLSLFLASSEDDSGFIPYMRWLSQFSQNPHNRLVEYKKAGHGTDMFAVEKDLEPQIVEWLSGALLEAPTVSAAATAQPNPQVEFWSILTGPDGATGALPILREARRRDPDAILLPELAAVILGSDLVRAGNPQEAVAVLRVGLEEYPDSIDLHFSLSGAYLEAGDRTMALQYCEKTLQLIDKDTTISDEEKEYYRKRIDERVQQLKAKQ